MIKCYNCGGGHFRNKCPSFKHQKKQDEKEKVLFSALLAEVRSSEWFFDSGATAHMTHEKDIVNNLVRPKKDHATAANGDSMKIIGMGDVSKSVAGSGKLKMEKVQVIPEICANLISVSQLVLADNEVIFNKRGCTVIDINRKTIATGRLENNMFKLNTSKEFACVAKSVCSKDIGLWHRRLGHVSFGNMSFLQCKVPSGLKCKICIKGKQPRTPFPRDGNRATKKLEIVHSDVCGPLKVQSIGGCRYFVTFIDDFTRKVFIYTIKYKSQVFAKFVDFVNQVETQAECKVFNTSKR